MFVNCCSAVIFGLNNKVVRYIKENSICLKFIFH